MGAESREALTLFNSAQEFLRRAEHIQEAHIAQGESFLQKIIEAIVT